MPALNGKKRTLHYYANPTNTVAESLKHPTIPKGLTAGPTLQAKLDRFAAAGAGSIHAVFDFDRTLTVKRPGTDDEVTTWHILREHLPAEGQRAYQTQFEKYRALEISGAMTTQDAVDWFSSSLDLFVQHRINLAAVEETFLERASIRPGTAELFKLLADHGIPTIILSAGIRDVIDIWCRHYRIQPSLVISTRMIVDADSTITDWDKDSLVHVRNKSEATHPELLAIRMQRPLALLVGDSMDDANMASGDQDVLRVRILDPRADEVVTAQDQQQTFTRFDALMQLGSLQPLYKLVDTLRL